MRLPFLHRIQALSLKWKIVIPFLLFSFTGTTVLTRIGLSSQQDLIRSEEEREISRRYQLVLQDLEDKKSLVLSLATMISEDPTVQRFLAGRDRENLFRHMNGTYVRLKRDFYIEQIHFHIPPGTSFLRLHRPKLFGDDLAKSRKSVTDAIRDKEPKAGIEQGRTGYGIRGVVPVLYKGKLAGSVEVGYSFGPPLLGQLQKRLGLDLALYTAGDDGEWEPLAGTSGNLARFPLDRSTAAEAMKRPLFRIEPEQKGRATLVGPVKDYSGKVIALLRLGMDRSEIKSRLAHTRNIMILVGLAGIVISFLLTYLVAAFLIRPLSALAGEAQEIAQEKRDHHIESGWKDEIGTLTEALNAMLDSLQAKRAEESRLLDEISAHMAHAIRNPLSSAGGFARRLQNGLPENDPNRRLAEIIVKEVVRIEDFLKVLFSSIRPFELSLTEVDINKVLESAVGRLEGPLKARELKVDCSFSPEVPKIQADEERLGEAFENILKHASILTPPAESLSLSTTRTGDRIIIRLAHRTQSPISQDDLDKFFFPHIEEKALWPIVDLSLSRRIIHRHGGKIDVSRQENDGLVTGIEMPVRVGR